jgi:pimeloyl-ACP methyl ester carboxylesterase
VSIPFAGAAATAAGAAAIYRRRRDDTPLLVVVHGHGGDADNFDRLIDMMDIDGARVVAFDYSWADGGSDSTSSSRSAPTADAAAALDAFMRQLAVTNSNMYSLHHSKGGAVGVSMIASLDDGSRPPIDGYRGAALLDPAIASGLLGELQSSGQGHGWLPDDGGFDPIRCSDAGCTDIRDHLGEASGVEVIAVRNRDALVTNFTDRPDGLRVFDLHDGLPSALLYGGLFLPRIIQAHNSVLTHTDVANCVKAEVSLPGSCEWGAEPPRQRFRGAGSRRMNLVL